MSNKLLSQLCMFFLRFCSTAEHRSCKIFATAMEKDNLNPTVYLHTTPRDREATAFELNNDVCDPFDEREIFDLIRDINDPEHPLSLEDLNVVSQKDVYVNNKTNLVKVSRGGSFIF